MRRTKKQYYRHQLARDFGVIFLGALAALAFARSGALDALLVSSTAPTWLVTFVVGIFFTSGFTILPATLALGVLATELPFAQFVFAGALGAAVGDFLMFFLVRDVFAEDLAGYLRYAHPRIPIVLPKAHVVRWLAPLFGALIVASPLPDEIGLTLMGLSRMKSVNAFLLLLCLNVVGVSAVAAAVVLLG